VPQFKLEVRKQFGMFQHRVFKTGDTATDFAGNDKSVKDMLATVQGALKVAGVKPGDEIVFRTVAYGDHDVLYSFLRDAPY
jgi:hypothetical protein